MKKIPLKTNPFTSTCEVPKVFITPAWQQHAELVTHLCQFSQNILLIVAPAGGGKTTFLNHLLKMPTMGPHLRLNAQQSVSTEELMRRVLREFHHQGASLVVDDAHLLTDETLQALCQLATCDQMYEPFHLILVGEPSLELRLFSPALTPFVLGKSYTIELEAWTLQDLTQFFAKDNVLRLTANQVACIFERCYGLPGNAIRERNAMLEQFTTTGKKMTNHEIKKKRFHPITLGVLVGVIAGGAYLYLNGAMEEEGNGSPVNAAQHSEDPWTKQEILPQKTTTAVAFDFDKDTVTGDEDATLDQGGRTMPLAGNVPTMDEASVTNQANTSPSQDPTQDAMVTTPQDNKGETAPTIVAGAPEAVQAITPLPELPTQVSKGQAKLEVKKPTKSEISRLSQEEKALLSADHHHYTLQLLGARKEESIKQFIQQYALKGKTYSFRTKRSGEDWYVVVYGDYPSAVEAKAAIHTMPTSLKQAKLQPWVREMQGIQEDIRKQG